MAKERLFKMSRVRGVRGKGDDMDSVKAAKQRGDRRAFDVLLQAQGYWDAMDRFRKDRERCKRYTYGDQWGDVVSVDGCEMTEEAYIESQGSVPLKNNLIRRLVRNVMGVYRSQSKEPTCTARDRDEQRLGETMSTVLQYNMQLNRMGEVNGRSMEEFLISGLVVHRKSYGWRNERLDCWTDYVNPNNFFVDTNMRDFRGWDCTCIGEVHDVDFETLCHEFAESPEDYRRFKEIYSFARSKEAIARYVDRFGYSRMENYDFLFTSDPTRCRVIEVWRKESKPRYLCHDWNSGKLYKIEEREYKDEVVAVNMRRLQQAREVGMSDEDVPLVEATWMMDTYWYYYYLTPFGHILKEGETPYEHKSHPYVFKAYPFIDGEIHSFVADVIDQQRYTNRLITLNDWMLRASAKGALLFPEEALPEGMSMDEIADEWTRFNGIIVYKAKKGVPVPQQIVNSQTHIGITELLNLQLKFFEDISGVNGALQGKPGYSQMSGRLYQQQTQNATTSLLDLLETFDSFVVEGAIKNVKNIQQFYDDKRVFNIAGKNGVIAYDPERTRDVEFDLSIAESQNTQAYREVSNEILFQLFQAQAISVEQLLEQGSFPFADSLLQSIRSQKEQLQQGQLPEGISPQLQQQAAAQADPQSMQRAQQMLRGA